MKTLKLLACCLLVLCAANMHAGNNNRRNWNEYKRGAAISLWGDGSIALDYYFLRDNTMSVSFYAYPYSYIKNEDAILGNTGHQVYIGADINYYFRLWPDQLKNRYFFTLGAGWTEGFGAIVSTSRIKEIQYAWKVYPLVGLQYRPNDHFYFGVTSYPFSYASTKIKDNEARITDISVFNYAAAYVVLKF